MDSVSFLFNKDALPYIFLFVVICTLSVLEHWRNSPKIIKKRLEKHIAKATKLICVTIRNPRSEILNDQKIVEAFKKAMKAGVKVQVLLYCDPVYRISDSRIFELNCNGIEKKRINIPIPMPSITNDFISVDDSFFLKIRNILDTELRKEGKKDPYKKFFRFLRKQDLKTEKLNFSRLWEKKGAD